MDLTADPYDEDDEFVEPVWLEEDCEPCPRKIEHPAIFLMRLLPHKTTLSSGYKRISKVSMSEWQQVYCNGCGNVGVMVVIWRSVTDIQRVVCRDCWQLSVFRKDRLRPYEIEAMSQWSCCMLIANGATLENANFLFRHCCWCMAFKHTHKAIVAETAIGTERYYVCGDCDSHMTKTAEIASKRVLERLIIALCALVHNGWLVLDVAVYTVAQYAKDIDYLELASWVRGELW